MTKQELLVERFKLEALMTELDIEMSYLNEDKCNLQKQIAGNNNMLTDLKSNMCRTSNQGII